MLQTKQTATSKLRSSTAVLDFVILPIFGYICQFPI